MQAPFFMAGINHANENQTPTKTKNNKNKQTNKQTEKTNINSWCYFPTY